MNPRLRCFCDAGPSTRLADVTPSRLPGGRLAAKIERPSGGQGRHQARASSA